jgi:hypothetical protein
MPLILKQLKRDWRRSENTSCPKGCRQGVPSKELFGGPVYASASI